MKKKKEAKAVDPEIFYFLCERCKAIIRTKNRFEPVECDEKQGGCGRTINPYTTFKEITKEYLDKRKKLIEQKKFPLSDEEIIECFCKYI